MDWFNADICIIYIYILNEYLIYNILTDRKTMPEF